MRHIAVGHSLALALTACTQSPSICAPREKPTAMPPVELMGTALARSDGYPPLPCTKMSEGGTLRILSWNIKVAQLEGIDAVVDELSRWNPDVVLLQEVDVGVERSGFLDQPRIIADRLGLEFVFAPTVVVDHGLYGIALLSRAPLHDVQRIPLSNSYACEDRAAIAARLCFGATELRIINHHADYAEAAASASIDEIIDSIGHPSSSTVFGGDLNQTPQGHGPKLALSAGLLDAIPPHNSKPTHGRQRIDFVFVDRDTARLITNAQILTNDASDHSAILVDLQAP